MKHIKARKKWVTKFFVILLFTITFYNIGSVIFPQYRTYINPYYTEAVYKNLEDAFNHSQYRQKNPTAIIPDDTVFSYAAGAYLRGLDPIYVNSETTPLGKYFIALCIALLKNDRFIVIPFGLFTLFMTWLLAQKLINNKILAFLPVTLLSYEKLFLNQFIYTPLLDIIQLPFILLTLYVFIIENKKQNFIFTAISLGFVMATKTVIPAILLMTCFVMYFFLYKQYQMLLKFFFALPLSVGILVFSYTRTFLDGYTLVDFYKFQKWIFLYQKSKLLFPLSVWRLIFLNQWQTWWGSMILLRADDWQITWPLFTSLGLITGMLTLLKKLKSNQVAVVLLLWFFIYGAFLSLGVVSSRFLLPFLPVVFIIGAYLTEQVYSSLKISHKKRNV